MVFTKNMLDSVETELLNTVDQYVQDAKKLLEDKQIIEASVKIQEIFDNVSKILKCVEQDVSLAGYSIQISPMLRVGMANYVVNTPGNVKIEILLLKNMKK